MLARYLIVGLEEGHEVGGLAEGRVLRHAAQELLELLPAVLDELGREPVCKKSVRAAHSVVEWHRFRK